MKHFAESMYDYHVWANERTLNHLLTLPEGVLQQEIQSVFKTLHDVVSHICLVDEVWMTAFSGEFSAEMKVDFESKIRELSQLSLEELQQRYADVAVQYRTHVGALQNLDETRVYTHPVFPTLTATYAELIMHVVNHATYHRGNITAMLRQLGYKGISTDYVHYLVENK
ncbi:DinB family protein [Paenibacillus arenosi]|uniref:Damage-inducible protein DinB n=1 Tax=Paenibacillus arenosi TaxID=2774142 RepID=A0ABR9B6M5_9BACL|nr:DinB family protein [Paenibacillus arenosi]MBD8500826.1 damage-inducible protein DinB [Paenibacillus arenosi]